MRLGPRLAAIAILAGMAGSSRADAVKVLDKAEDAALARVEMIRHATRSIDAMYYTVGDDSVSLAVLALMRDAARRGVTVRFVIDGHFNFIPDDVEALLLRDGIQIREFQPFRPWRPNWWTRRLHDKLLIVDGQAVITGGRNIAAPYYGRGDEINRRDYLDRDVYVAGDAAGKAAAYFDRMWAGTKVRKTNLGAFRPKRLERRCELIPDPTERERCERLRQQALGDLNEADRNLDLAREQAEIDPLFAPSSDGGPAAEAIDVGAVTFLHDPAGGKRDDVGIAVALVEILDAARTSVVIDTPYFIPSEAVEASLRAAVVRGVDVRVVTNALTATDNVLAQAAYFQAKDDIVSWGVELWEYPGPDCLHAKSMVVDERLTVIGSFNLDPRSELLNSEVAMVIDDPRIAAEVLAAMESNRTKSYRIGPDGNPLPGPVEPEKASLMKRSLLRVLELVAPFIREQI